MMTSCRDVCSQIFVEILHMSISKYKFKIDNNKIGNILAPIQMGEHELNAERQIPVSYTHLDVYKRQFQVGYHELDTES